MSLICAENSPQLNTAQVEAYVLEHFPSDKPIRLEWIDDTSLNVLYPNSAIASQALTALQSPNQPGDLPLVSLRPAMPFSASPDSRLSLRIAKTTDRKERGARERSRYYLFHPEEDRADRFERERRRPLPRRRSGGSRDRDRGDYSRRYYDAHEDGARRRQDDYTEDMYDDDPPARQRQRRPTRSRSPGVKRRDRSFSPRPRRQRNLTRSRSPVELFPGRVKKRGIELFPERPTRSSSQPESSGVQQTKELFPGKVGGSTAAMDNYTSPPLPLRNTSASWKKVELFPEHSVAQFGQFNQLPHRIALEQKQQRALSLAERITMPKRSLADRITLPGDESNRRGNGELKIRGTARDGVTGNGDDLFAQKMMNAKGEGLVSDGMGVGSGGRRRRGRKKADEWM
jgi:hypothetical protein